MRPDHHPEQFTEADGQLALSILWQLVGAGPDPFAHVTGPYLALDEGFFHASIPELELLERLEAP